MSDGGAVPSRADARRNRALVLQAARSAFEERGLRVPLGEIARRAGVGAGTVYRHFPSKEALFRASVRDRMRLFADTATDLAEVDDPGGVFFRFLASVVRLAARNRALCDALEAAGEDGPEPLGEASRGPERDFVAALGVLLVRAQEAGAVRADVQLEDVRVLLVGCTAMERRRAGVRGPADGGAGSGAASAGRMTALVLDGLRAVPTVTELPPAPTVRNETGGGAGSATGRGNGDRDKARNASRGTARCQVCGEAIAAARTGRPARYCGGACRQKAHRARGRARGGTS
ncbi:TetR family transcriptional regulator [Streptomyces sp. GS7]|nr:TetR family transcriptional regulator [Streptomyces sp. GS7]